MRLAIFGGTFDPIHNAHLAIARDAAARFRLDRVSLSPARIRRIKPGPPTRLTRTASAWPSWPAPASRASKFRAWNKTPGAATPSTRSKNCCAHMSPGDELFFLIGADAFAEIDTWRRWRDVAAAVRFLVVSRPGHCYQQPPEVRAERLDTLELPVSSSEIRRVLAYGGRPAEVPAPVLDYILRNGLYRA